MDVPPSVQRSTDSSQPDMSRPLVDLTPISTTESNHASIVESLLEDPLLSDLTPQVTLEEVKTLIAIEEGRAYKIRIERQRMEAIRKPTKYMYCIKFQLINIRVVCM